MRTAIIDAIGCGSNPPAGKYRVGCPQCPAAKPRNKNLWIKVHDDRIGWLCHRCGWKGAFRLDHQTVDQPINGRKFNKNNGSAGEGAGQRPASTQDEEKEYRRKLAIARRLLDWSGPIKGSRGEAFLRNRGIEPPGDTSLVFLSRCWHWPTEQKRPCIIAPIVDVHDNALLGLHQTFLNDDCRDRLPDELTPRLYYGRKAGGCVKLTPDTEVTIGLCVGEGLETCLTALMCGHAVWALLDAGNLRELPPLSGVESLLILVDNDEAGRTAAAATAARWVRAGKEVRLAQVRDAGEGGDWNDRLIDLEDEHG